MGYPHLRFRRSAARNKRSFPFATPPAGLWLCLGLFCLSRTITFSADLLQSPSLTAVFHDGTVLALTNRLTGESYAGTEGVSPPLAALHRPGNALLEVRAASGQCGRDYLEQVQHWPEEAARWQLRAEVAADSDDLIVTQQGRTEDKGLSGISWGIAGIPDDFEILVPGTSGQRFDDRAPAGRREFDYPLLWEAPFVLVQGRDGGWLVRAEDVDYRFKNLRVDHARGVFGLRFESRHFAPFEDKDRIESSRWRLTAYRGSWLSGAALYRQWVEGHYALTPWERQQPSWVRDIQFVVTMNLEPDLLPELARQANPSQTLLYLPNWRRDEYDRNYPDYTASPRLDPFIQAAHQLGFRVMPHVNYFGCDPKHPIYARFQPWQLRDPFSKERLWWDWPYAHPPIKFAYINPASREWRALFVERMRELAEAHRVDALHLDQTLCIYNDANGLIDGLNSIQGNVALHRELRAALPEVALSGEGLNEVTCRYEAFAQRHVWGMDHARGTWNNRWIAMSHPISSAILTPYTKLYGYLGMVNPADTGAFVAWRRAYECFGVLPTYTWPTRAQLDHPPPYLAELLTQAKFFNEHRPIPDFETAWRPEELFVYRLADGRRACFRRDAGVVFAVESPTPFGQKEQPQTSRARNPSREDPHPLPPAAARQMEILTRRIEGVSEARVPGSIPGWPAYDATRFLGLDPQGAYGWSSQPPDPEALHLIELPPGTIIEQSGQHPEFSRFRFGRAQPGDFPIRLWDYNGNVRPGVQIAGEPERSGDLLDFLDAETGAQTHPDGEGLFFHPPWRNLQGKKGRHVTFLEYQLPLPKAEGLAFTARVRLRDAAVGQSDGVRFRVVASCEDHTQSQEADNDRANPMPLRLDLSSFAGHSIRLRIEVDAGPKGNPSFDWALLGEPKIVVESPQAPTEEMIRLAGSGDHRSGLTVDGPRPVAAQANGTADIRVPIPGSLILPRTPPRDIVLPCDLLAIPFTSHVVYADGIEMPASGYFGGTATQAKCGGIQRRALSLHPPTSGSSLADYLLRLPEASVRLVTALGIRDGSKSRGVTFEVQVNGHRVLRQSRQPDTGWVPVEVDLSRWRGQMILLSLITDAEGDYQFDWAVWAEPRLLATAP